MAMDIIKEKHPLYETPMSEIIPLFSRLTWDKFDQLHDEVTVKHKDQKWSKYSPPERQETEAFDLSKVIH